MDNKNIASKRFYLAFIVGIAGLVLLIFCTFGFLYSGIKSELKARTDVAINLIGDRNNELFGELEILAGNIKAYQAQKNENEYARRNFYSQLVENTALQKKNFDAIFFIRLFGANELTPPPGPAPSPSRTAPPGPWW